MQGFDFRLDTQIHFGTDILDEAVRKESRWIRGNILVVTTGRSLVKYGHLDQVRTCLRQAEGVTGVFVYDGVSANPRLEEVMEAIRLGREVKADAVVGFGGGSALDAAKAAAVGIPNASTLEQMEEYLLRGKEPESNTLPIIAIPTTAGTGSELSRGAILSSARHHIKSGIRGTHILPKSAIVDARFTLSVPHKATMETGFDVLAHAIESYVSVKANMFSEMLSEQAVKLVGENLRILNKNLDDIDAREKMSYASMIMGINLANVGTCLPHRMQYPIGAQTDTSHAAGLAALYPAWMEYEYEVNRAKIEKVMLWLGLEPEKGGVGQQIRRFQQELGIEYSLRGLGIQKDEVQALAAKVTGNMASDKLYRTEGVLLKIMKASL